MSLPSGAKLGPYEVMAPLGAGGMGEVYRARDTRLDRTVAIKVLPEHLAQSPDLQQRFEREARAVSAINHPHICALYDIGHQDGTDYLVLEYLEGESLHDRLAKDPLPLDQALRRATEIADALDKAHRSGVVHRDLKPGNVILTKAGAKLLDFGLAKRAEPVVKGDERLSALATRAPLTEKGTLVGTIPYMAPEQIEGREADARTDIWAFGALLYEMVTGKRAFVGTSPASLIGAILKDEPPPIRELKPLTPPSLERLVKTCLAKDPDERWQNAHDLVAELRWIADEGTRASATAAEPSGKGPVARAVPWLVTLATVAVAAWALWTRSARGTADLPVQQLEVGFPADIEPRPDVAGGGLDLSPDGRLVAMTGVKRARRMAFVRRLDSTEVLEVSSEGGVNGVVFSPEGRRIAILGGNGRITSLSLVDRQRTELVSGADVTGSLGWGEAGVVFARNGALWMAPAGGESRALSPLSTPPVTKSCTRDRCCCRESAPCSSRASPRSREPSASRPSPSPGGLAPWSWTARRRPCGRPAGICSSPATAPSSRPHSTREPSARKGPRSLCFPADWSERRRAACSPCGSGGTVRFSSLPRISAASASSPSVEMDPR
jgi:eukaryotic-like serine/threonine-protein kinase